MIMYHVTTVARTKRILKEGLKPRGTKRKTAPQGSQKYVYVFGTLSMAISFGSAIANKKSPRRIRGGKVTGGKLQGEIAILLIDGDGIAWFEDPCWDCAVAGSFVTTETISPKRILAAQSGICFELFERM